MVRTLQRSLLPHSLPLLPGLEVAARYHPVGGRSEVGGDFYDVFPLGRGRWGAAIGDVCGKGVMAAQLTALARYTVRTAARSEARPSGVLEVLNRSLLDHETGDRFCTIVQAFIDTAEEPVRVTLSCAGHPLPLLVDAAGEVRPLGRPGTAVGLFATPDGVRRHPPAAAGRDPRPLHRRGDRGPGPRRHLRRRAAGGRCCAGPTASRPTPSRPRWSRPCSTSRAGTPATTWRCWSCARRRPGSGSGWRRRPRACPPAAAGCGRG